MTRYIPNYSSNDTATEAQISYYYSTFTQSPFMNIFDKGKYNPYMPINGMREEIGIMPHWCALWITNGDWRMREMSIVHAELSGAWRSNYREADPNLFFDRNHSIPGVGRPMSINGHPDIWFPDHNGVYPQLGSPINIFTSGWSMDNSHQPDPHSVVYMLTGDYYYYESLYFWACNSVLSMQASIYGRGLPGWAGVNDQVRGVAWLMRTRTYAHLFSPDNTPEQQYMSDCVEDAIAYIVGQHLIDDPNYRNRTNYIWATKNVAFDWSPLRFYRRAGRTGAFWEEAFLMVTLGMMRDLGYKVDLLLSEYSTLFTSQIGAPGHDPRYNAYNSALNQYPNGTWYQTWAEFKQQNDLEQFESSITSISGWDNLNFYSYAVTAASAFLVPYRGGMDFFNWTKTTVFDRAENTGFVERSWRIYPRSNYIPSYRDDPIPVVPISPAGPIIAIFIFFSCWCSGPIAFMIFGVYFVNVKNNTFTTMKEKLLRGYYHIKYKYDHYNDDLESFQTRNESSRSHEYNFSGDIVPPTSVMIGGQIGEESPTEYFDDSQAEYYKVRD